MIFFLVKVRRSEAARWKASDASASFATEVTQASGKPVHKVGIVRFKCIVIKQLTVLYLGMSYPYSDSEVRRTYV